MIVVYFIVSNCFRKKDRTCFSKLLSKHAPKPSPSAKSVDNTEYNFKIGNHCNTMEKPEAVKNLCCKINRISLKNIMTSETVHKTVAARSSTEVRPRVFPDPEGRSARGGRESSRNLQRIFWKYCSNSIHHCVEFRGHHCSNSTHLFSSQLCLDCHN